MAVVEKKRRGVRGSPGGCILALEKKKVGNGGRWPACTKGWRRETNCQKNCPGRRQYLRKGGGTDGRKKRND